MKCLNCGHKNRTGAKFCEECAAPLVSVCANCGAQLSSTAKFCSECAHHVQQGDPGRPLLSPAFDAPNAYTPKYLAQKILNSRAAIEGERKQVTVLFADLKDSTELLADRDPEEARNLLEPLLHLMMEAVHHYEGTVNQAAGDGIMALFGAPVAHEDHAVRACYAALRMQVQAKRYGEDVYRTLGANLQIRVGLNSGEVVVGTIGSDLRMDYTAVGRTTHLAARMEQLARPGAILLTPATLGLVPGLVTVKSLGLATVKGVADPLEVHELIEAGPGRTRFRAAAQRGLTRFVGRDVELEQLRRLQSIAHNSRGQVISIVAEPGMGKSRLVYELSQSPISDGWLVLECTAVSYGKAMSYLPITTLLKAYFGIADADTPRQIRDKLTNRLLTLKLLENHIAIHDQDSPRAISDKTARKLLTLDRALQPILPALLAVLDVPVDDAPWQSLHPTERRRRMLDAVRRLLFREAREQPLLLIFEDLHWIDSETQALLDGLVEHIASARVLLLATYRPEYQHGWASKPYHNQVRLNALSADHAGGLLDSLLGNDPSLTPLKKLLVRDGNPFVLEESVRTLAETKTLEGLAGSYRLTRPVEAIQVPATVQAMLAARIDRLSPQDKHLLQIAAVIGRRVRLSLLQAVANLPDGELHRGLGRLQAAEFVREAGLPPFADSLRSFLPDLEFSFNHALTQEVAYSGLLRDRRRALHAQIVEVMERLHSDRLGEQVERLAHHAVQGALREKAVKYLQQAGKKAATRSALLDARVWFEQALIVLEGLPDTKSTLESSFEVRFELRHMLFQLGEVRQGLEHLREAEALAKRLNDDYRRGRVFAAQMHLHAILGELDEALAAGNRALELATRLGDSRLRIMTMSHLAQVHYYRAEYRSALEVATTTLSKLPAAGTEASFELPTPPAIYNRFWLAASFAELGQFAEAIQCGGELLKLAESIQLPFAVGSAHWVIAASHLLRGDAALAYPLIEQAVAVFRACNVAILLPAAIAQSASVLAQLGEVREALTRLWFAP